MYKEYISQLINILKRTLGSMLWKIELIVRSNFIAWKNIKNNLDYKFFIQNSIITWRRVRQPKYNIQDQLDKLMQSFQILFSRFFYYVENDEDTKRSVYCIF